MVEAGVLWRRLAVKESLTKEFDINWRCWWRCWWWGWGGQQFVQMFPLWLFSTWSVAGRWQLPPVHHADSWANTCQLLCHHGAILSLYQSSSNPPLINLVSRRLTGWRGHRRRSLISPVPSPVGCQSPSRFWREESPDQNVKSLWHNPDLSASKDVKTSLIFGRSTSSSVKQANCHLIGDLCGFKVQKRMSKNNRYEIG